MKGVWKALWKKWVYNFTDFVNLSSEVVWIVGLG